MASRRFVSLTASTLAWLLSSCGTAPDSGDAVPTWTLREEWRVGGEVDGPHSFDANLGLGMLPGDSLVHLDHQNQQFHVLDPAGKPVRSFGRKGAGPGETTDANGFAVGPTGEIVVNDRGNNRLARFDATGRFLGAATVPTEFTIGVRWNAGFLTDGRLLERHATATDSMGVRVWLDRTRLWARDLSTFDDIEAGACLVSPRPAASHAYIAIREGADAFSGLLPLPYSGPWLANVHDPAGFIWGLAISDTVMLQKVPIGQCTPVATVVLGDTAPIIPPAIADSALDVIDGIAKADGRTLPAGTAIPARFPPFWTLHLDDRHQLWVSRFGPNGEQRMDVHDADGVLVARVNNFPLNPRWPILFHKDRLYGFVSDDHGIRYLVALAIVR